MLFDKKTEFESQMNQSDADALIINSFLQKQKMNQDLQIKKDQNNQELLKVQTQLTKIETQTNQVLKKYFQDFDIDLFKDDENQGLLIKQKGVPIEFLNSSNRINILLSLNEILGKKLDLDCFCLIDNAESINQLYQPKNNQIIATYVTNDKELKVNEQIIN